MNDRETIAAMLERAGLAFKLSHSDKDGGSYIQLAPAPIDIEFGPAGELEGFTVVATA